MPKFLAPIDVEILFTKSPLGDLGVKRLEQKAGITIIAAPICASKKSTLTMQ